MKNRPIEIQEAEFQSAFNLWEQNGKKFDKNWERMWIRVSECCKAICLKIAPGKPQTAERSVDATIMVMDRIIRLNKHPQKLSSYCFWPCKAALQGPKAMREDLEGINYDVEDTPINILGERDYSVYYEPYIQEGVRGIWRAELVNTID